MDAFTHYALGARLAGLALPAITLPDEHHVILRRMRFHYLDWGTAGRPAVVLLHGGGQTAHTWDLICLALRGEYHCLALDQRGHGDSEWSPTLDYDPDAHAADVAAFVDHLGLERFVLIGMSMGCIHGLHYALREPDRVAGFVAVDAGPSVRVAGGAPIIEFRRATATLDSLDAYVEHALRFNPRRDARLLRWSLRHNLHRLRDGRWTWKTDPGVRPDLDDMARRLDALWADLHRITAPTLVVRGAESEVFRDEDAARFAAALPDGRWVRVAAAGHTVQGDNPRGLVEELRRFLPLCR